MESEERLRCLLHFRTDIARCSWTVSEKFQKKAPGFGRSGAYTAPLKHISRHSRPHCFKSGEGACDERWLELHSRLLSAHQRLQSSKTPPPHSPFLCLRSRLVMSLKFCSLLSLHYLQAGKKEKKNKKKQLGHTVWVWRSGRLETAPPKVSDNPPDRGGGAKGKEGKGAFSTKLQRSGTGWVSGAAAQCNKCMISRTRGEWLKERKLQRMVNRVCVGGVLWHENRCKVGVCQNNLMSNKSKELCIPSTGLQAEKCPGSETI